MKELDFDELDKAVNTLMAKVPADKEAKAAVKPAVPVSAEAKASSAPTTESKTDSKAPAKLVVPQRSSGRFMDVMHPSSDMRTPAPVSAPSREGTTVAAPAGLKAPATPVKQPSVPPVAPAVPPVPAAETTPAVPEKNDDKEPAFSPFLPGTKVEKRPLGGMSEPMDAAASTDEKPAETMPDPIDTAVTTDETPKPAAVPAELKADVIAIEADDEHDVGSELMPEHKFTPPAKADPLTSDTPAAPEPTSIVQQYKEQPSSGDQSHQAIYDSSPAPLIHPAKKKSGWLWVLWIVLLLVVGAGGAALLYLLKII